MSIIIFSNSIHTGKTQTLLSWCTVQTNVAGILMPILNNKRWFFNIDSKEYFLAEDDSLNSALKWQIGRYSFSQTAFAKANAIIKEAINQNKEYVVIDELGFLELEQKGFFEAWEFALQEIDNHNFTNKLVLVVRSNLLQSIIDRMQHLQFTIVNTW